MAQTFECPTCGAPLEPHGSDPTLKCIHCGNTVIVPAELRTAPAVEQSGDLSGALGQLGRLKEVAQLARSGRKIEAIKIYREITGLGLKEAKDAVEAMEAGQPVMMTSQTFSTQAGAGVSGSPEVMREVVRLARAGQTEEAVQHFRSATGASQQQARETVEAIATAAQAAEAAQGTTTFAPATSSAEVPPALLAEIRNLVSSGNKLEAIAVYRRHFSAGLAEAKAAVEALEAGQPLPVPAGGYVSAGTGASAPARSSGCGRAFAVLGGLVALAAVALGLIVPAVFKAALSAPVSAPTLPAVVARALPTLSQLQLEATTNAKARATQAAAGTAAARAEATQAGTATAEADAATTEQANATATVEAQAIATSISDTQAAWKPIAGLGFNSGKWDVGRQADGYIAVTRALQGNKYLWTVTPKQGNSYMNVLLSDPTLADFAAKVDVRFVRGGKDGGYAYGVAFNGADRDYVFFGIQNDGHFRILVVANTGIYEQYDYASPAIHPDQVNHLQVRAVDQDAVFLINDQYVWHLALENPASGEIGLGVDVLKSKGEAQVEFSNFEVRQP